MPTPNKVQLIVYPDAIGHNLVDLEFFLSKFDDLIKSIHILPFYPSSFDRGYAPLTHLHVDEKFGTWENIMRLSRKYYLTGDMMVNHLSRESKYFLDFWYSGKRSAYSDLFLTLDKLSPSGKIRRSDLQLIYRPRPGYPLLEATFGDGQNRALWCTFSEHQIDLNNLSPLTLKMHEQTIEFLANRGVKTIRLDAVGYAIKKLRTNSFLIPETYDFISILQTFARNYGVELLAEVHSNYLDQIKLSDYVDYVYDFALPGLVLHTLMKQDNTKLLEWLRICPENQITTLDTHDGIPIRDLDDLLSEDERRDLVDDLHKKGGNSIRRPIQLQKNEDLYQVNITYYSALDKNDDKYIAARALQFFTPGIPQIYYVGFLAGVNDYELFHRTGEGRDVNRHYYTTQEAIAATEKPYFTRLAKLIKFRNEFEAFDGDFKIHESPTNKIELSWEKGQDFATLSVDLTNFETFIIYREKGKPLKSIKI